MDRHKSSKSNRFDKNPRATLLASICIILLLFIGTAEVCMEKTTGLGNPVLYDINPLYGYRPKPNQVIEPFFKMGSLYGSRVRINNLGLRGANNWDANPSNKILFLGDSVTYGGQYVDDEQLFTTIAGQTLPGWQMGNGGVNAWGVENIVGLVMDAGFNPSGVVVTCLIEADFYRGLTRAGSVPLWIEKPRFALYNLMMHHIWRANESRYGSSTDFLVQDQKQLDKIVARAARRLRELDDYLKQHQVKHIIFILPTKGEVLFDDQVDSRVRNALAQHNINATYLLPKLQALEKDISIRYGWFHDDVHLEPVGHSAYGTIMSRELSAVLKLETNGL